MAAPCMRPARKARLNRKVKKLQMAQNLRELNCTEFAAVLASREPVPGGGGASALAGALAAALCSMVGNLTLGRKKYAQYEDDIRRVLDAAEALRKELLELIDADAAAFQPLSRAYSIPKDDPKREEVMRVVLADACAAPLQMMDCCCQVIDLLEEMQTKGSRLLISDVACGALLARAALDGAGMNVYINTKALPDREKAAELEARADAMRKVYLPKAEKIAAEVEAGIRAAGK